MGYIIIYPPAGQAGEPVVLGDAVGQNQARRDMGLPHYDNHGRYVSADEIERRDEIGA